MNILNQIKMFNQKSNEYFIENNEREYTYFDAYCVCDWAIK